MRSAIAYPRSSVIPVMNVASVWATWSKVLWSSLRTITRQASSSPDPGPWTRGSSTVSLTEKAYPGSAGLLALAPVAVEAVPLLLGRQRLEVGGGRGGIGLRGDLVADVLLEGGG